MKIHISDTFGNEISIINYPYLPEKDQEILLNGKSYQVTSVILNMSITAEIFCHAYITCIPVSCDLDNVCKVTEEEPLKCAINHELSSENAMNAATAILLKTISTHLEGGLPTAASGLYIPCKEYGITVTPRSCQNT